MNGGGDDGLPEKRRRATEHKVNLAGPASSEQLPSLAEGVRVRRERASHKDTTANYVHGTDAMGSIPRYLNVGGTETLYTSSPPMNNHHEHRTTLGEVRPEEQHLERDLHGRRHDISSTMPTPRGPSGTGDDKPFEV